jgi:hypothetical protein
MELSGGRDRRVIVLGALVVLAALVAVVVFVVLPGDEESSPAVTWDPAVVDLVEFVQTARGLPFTQAVEVVAVDADGFAAEVGAAEPSAADVRAAGDTLRLLRALGLVTERGDDEELAVDAARAVLDGDDRARFVPAANRIVVRAAALDDLDEDTEAALVGALGTALHHQHFGLAAGSPFDRSAAGIGRRALSAGVGAAIADRYVVEVQERELREWRLAEVRRWEDDAAGLVAAYSLLGPQLGEPLVLVALADARPGEGQSWARVAELIAEPPASEFELLQPWAAIDGFVSVLVPAPEVEGEVLTTGDFGAASLYLTAALRVDPRQALAASLEWAGDVAVVSRDGDGRLCATVAVQGVDGDASDLIQDVLEDWVRAGPRSADASVERDGRTVILRSCEARQGDDPGIELDPASAIAVPASRTDLLAELRADGRRRQNAVCVADYVLAGIPVTALTDADRPPEAETLYELLRRDADSSCRRV